MKQEPVETKELIFEADKVPKSRYKKVMPPVPPSPVSRHQKSVFSLMQHDEKSTLSFYRLTKLLPLSIKYVSFLEEHK